eukprot:Seg798.9 transcript_id=Seg798.9/GoldUCD/mRNA.D3Y31 product="hypothetical protein" protein_id=Seg798.9/GoldUCD/D3Y31
MAGSNARKGSRFLEDLDEYYKAREKHTYSFSNVPCPQNFIPGATKAKAPSVKLLRNMSRKVSSVCYGGVVVRMKDNMTVAEKGLIPAGLLALGVPTPSQHTSCLEHELERIRQKQSTECGNFPGVHESFHSLDEEIQVDEDKMLLGVAKSKQRGCSLPITSRDVSTLPVVSFDENVVAEFGRQERTSTEIRRQSYPLSDEDYEAYKPRAHDVKPTHFRQMDSVSRLGALCRVASYYGSTPGNSSRPMTNEGLSYSRWKRTGKKRARPLSKGKSKSNNKGQSKELGDIQESGMPKFPWQEAAIKSQSSNTNGKQESDKESQGSNANETKKENADSKKKGEGQDDRKSFKERFILKRNKSRKNVEEESEELSTKPDKQTLAQIQEALRSKLPRTMQTTVKMGLSFDPITVKERSNTARDCSTLTAMLANRSRSMSTPGTPERLRREGRSQTLGNIFTTPSFMLSPPDEEETESEDKTTLFDSLIKLGKDTLSKSAEKVAMAIRKEALKVPSDTDLNLMKKDLSELSLTDVHIKKLQSLLGPEFSDVYAKERSNSLPLMRKRRMPIVKKVPLYARSASEISGDHIFIPTVNFSHLWSSEENSDADTSGSRTSKGGSTENELSDYELLDDDTHTDVRPNGKAELKRMDGNSNSKFRSVKLVYLSNSDAEQNATGTKNTELNGERPLGFERDAMKIKRCYSVPAESPANSDVNSSSSSANHSGKEQLRPKLSQHNSLHESIAQNDNAKDKIYHSKNTQHNKFATLPARKRHNGSNSFDTKNVRYIRAFQQSPGLQGQKDLGVNNRSVGGHSNGKHSVGVRPEVVALKSSIVLKSTKELIEDFKGIERDAIQLGETPLATEDQDNDNKSSEHDAALAELDALLQEFEEYNNC